MSQILKPKKGYKTEKWLFGKEIEIPEEWEVKKIMRISEKISVGIASSTTKYVVKEGVPLIRNQNITEEKIDIVDLLYISKEFAQDNLSKQIHEGDIICTRTGYTGRSAVVPPEMNGWQTFTTLIITPKKKIINSFYFSRFLNSIYAKTQIISFQAGSSQQNLNAGKISNVLILLPPLPEQQKIITILFNIDNLLFNTKKIIYQTKSIKKGLMQKILTKGIGHKKFKKVTWLFGKTLEIPEGWQLVPLNKYSTLKDGDWILEENYSDKGVRLLQIGDIGLGNFIGKSQKYISKKTSNELKCTIIKQGTDILISRMPTPIGRACIAPSLPYSYIVAVDISILKNDGEKIDRNYLVYTLNSSKNLNYVQKYVAGTTRQRINRKNLELVSILLPPLPEQQKIASILSNIDYQIQSQTQYKEKLERLRKSLMQKLLTGEVRVKI